MSSSLQKGYDGASQRRAWPVVALITRQHERSVTTLDDQVIKTEHKSRDRV